MEKIRNSAILKDEVIYEDLNHSLIRLAQSPLFFKNCEEGFVTTENRFVDRIEALIIAQNAAQLTRPPIMKNELDSTDLIIDGDEEAHRIRREKDAYLRLKHMEKNLNQ